MLKIDLKSAGIIQGVNVLGIAPEVREIKPVRLWDNL